MLLGNNTRLIIPGITITNMGRIFKKPAKMVPALAWMWFLAPKARWTRTWIFRWQACLVKKSCPKLKFRRFDGDKPLSSLSFFNYLVPVRRLPRPSRSTHFGDVSETNARTTWSQTHRPRGTRGIMSIMRPRDWVISSPGYRNLKGSLLAFKVALLRYDYNIEPELPDLYRSTKQQ